MTTIELYINNQLVDIESPDSFSIYLKRQLINPAELSRKDAQKSYDITLPASPTNNRIFGHINVEEVKGKFATLYDAKVWVGGVNVFDGKFKISEISKEGYRGNLAVPAQTMKDVFGEKKMHEGGEWKVDFVAPQSFKTYNEMDNPPVFFPLVLYGIPNKGERTSYSSKTLWDDTVAPLPLDKLPPSVNCLKLYKKFFDVKGFKLSGTAFDDERLKRLYMSYKNSSDYKMPWNYAGFGRVKVTGTWSPVRNGKIEDAWGYREIDKDRFVYISRLEHSSNSEAKVIEDLGATVNLSEGRKAYIKVPFTGLYKIRLKVDLRLDTSGAQHGDIFNSQYLVGSANDKVNLTNRQMEVHLLRGRDIDNTVEAYDDLAINNIFYQNNEKQLIGDSKTKVQEFPKEGAMHRVDPKQYENFLCGFSFGNTPGYARGDEYRNPCSTQPILHNPMAIRGGESWEEDNKYHITCAAATSPKYNKRRWNGATGSYDIETTKGYDVQLTGLPNDVPQEKGAITAVDTYSASGTMYQLVELVEGERITLFTVSDIKEIVTSVFGKKVPMVINHSVDYELELEPYMENAWLKLDEKGNSSNLINWEEKNGASQVWKNEIDLFRFMPRDMKIDDWISNFNKAFNLSLVQTSIGAFELNTRTANEPFVVIDLDTKTDLRHRKNSPLGLPSSYEFTFNVDMEEEGYVETQETGNSVLTTGSTDNKVAKEEISFSYNWLKAIEMNRQSQPKQTLMLPVVGKSEVWSSITYDYADMQQKSYTDSALRFWYKADKSKNFSVLVQGGNEAAVAQVLTAFNNGNTTLQLDYKNKPESILHNYFTLLADADNYYTTVECYLSPAEYVAIDNAFARLNSDLYYVAEVDGYDPMGRRPATLKLIRQQI